MNVVLTQLREQFGLPKDVMGYLIEFFRPRAPAPPKEEWGRWENSPGDRVPPHEEKHLWTYILRRKTSRRDVVKDYALIELCYSSSEDGEYSEMPPLSAELCVLCTNVVAAWDTYCDLCFDALSEIRK